MQERNDCLHVCLDAMQSDESGNMWECYCKDFLFHKLHIKEANSLTVLFLQSYVGAIDRTNVASCMASLHIHIEEHRLKIPQLLHILRPISKFSASDVETTLHLSKSQLALTQLTSTTTPTSPPKDIKEFVPDVYSFIVALLYEYLKSRTVAIVKSTLHISEVTKWCDCYHDIVSYQYKKVYEKKGYNNYRDCIKRTSYKTRIYSISHYAPGAGCIVTK